MQCHLKPTRIIVLHINTAVCHDKNTTKLLLQRYSERKRGSVVLIVHVCNTTTCIDIVVYSLDLRDIQTPSCGVGLPFYL